MDAPKSLSLMESVESFIRRVYAELLQKVEKSDGSAIGSEFRIVGDIIYTDVFLGELNDLEECIYEAVKKDGYISKSAAEVIEAIRSSKVNGQTYPSPGQQDY